MAEKDNINPQKNPKNSDSNSNSNSQFSECKFIFKESTEFIRLIKLILLNSSK